MRKGYSISWTKLTMLSLIFLLSFTSILLMKTCANLSTRVEVADTYIKALETEVEYVNPTFVDDVLSETDEYSDYYMSL